MAQKYEFTVEVADNGKYILRAEGKLEVCDNFIELLESIGLIVTDEEEAINLTLKRTRN